jgi:hypothetical protein
MIHTYKHSNDYGIISTWQNHMHGSIWIADRDRLEEEN